MTNIVRYKPAVACILGLCAALVVWGHWFLAPGMLDSWEGTTYDWRLRLHNAPSVSPDVLTIGRDVESVQRFGGGVWDRVMFARVITALGEAGAAVVAPDFYFAGPSPPERGGILSDEALVESTKAMGRVVYPIPIQVVKSGVSRIPPGVDPLLTEAVGGTFPPLASPIHSLKHAHVMGGLLPELATHAIGLGHIAAISDDDGVYRRVPLYVNVGDQALPSFGLSIVAAFLRVSPDQIAIQPGADIIFHDATFPDGTVRNVSFPIDAEGQMLIHYAGRWEEGIVPYLSFVDVWDAIEEGRLDELRAAVNGKIVILLPAAISADKRQTPLELKAPGGFIHANLVNTLLTGQWLQNVSQSVWAMSTVLLGVLAAWMFLLAPGWWGILCIIGLLIAYVVVVQVCFVAAGFVLPVLAPLYAALLSSGFVIAVHNRFILSVFGKFLSPKIVPFIVQSREGLVLGGKKRKVTILMSDLRGFTSMCEGLDPEIVVLLLNRYLERMIEIIEDHQGIVSDFMGDAILVTFGADRSSHDDARRAVACAVSMQLAMASVNERNSHDGLPRIHMGIGVNTGDVVVGNIGSEKRMKYDVIGSHVNLASRIESNTVGGQVLISESTKNDAGDTTLVGKKIDLLAKGIKDPVAIYDVLGIRGEPTRMLPKQEETLTLLREAIPIRYVILDRKQCDGTWFHGHFVKLSLNEGELSLKSPVPLLSNLKMNMTRTNGEDIPGELYGKVVETLAECTNGGARVSVRFTSIPPEVASAVRDIVSIASADP